MLSVDSTADAPEIDGRVCIDRRVCIDGAGHLKAGAKVFVEVAEAGEHDLWGEVKGNRMRFTPV